ncbi:hypothetical protein GTQ43_17150 [Nostoc sp. KVJ3]|uniref:hypothetical protein n=1 Tax=Nostoc sp. KVJ3 TaxID=457945 RepID=UPI0022380C56|nr:hypothetical protein [Nostoc sp. KVJ3]MCW5315473.1 hypothetical protein [Nostoc sp. KVJ3]
MSTQKPSQLRNSFLKAIAKQATFGIALLGMSLPLYTLMIGQPAIAAHHHKQKQNPVTPDVMPTPNPAPAAPKQMPQNPTLMESFFFRYDFNPPPIVNGVASPQFYIGTGFAPIGKYHTGQTITIFDNTGLKQIGVYTIGRVNDTVPFNAQQINQINISEYDWGNTHIIQGTGLGTSAGANGLGSESGSLLARGLEGSNAPFNNHQAGIRNYHF